MLPSPRYREVHVAEDADEGSVLRAPYAKPAYKATEVAMEESWPAWRCECNQPNDGWRYVCGMCGLVREDADSCA